MSLGDFDFDSLLKNSKALSVLGDGLAEKGVRRAMQDGMADLKVATVALARVDTHTMEKSVYYRTEATQTRVVGEVGVTAQDEKGYPYAIRQHEDLSLDNGPKSELKPAYDGMEVGPKYLERPWLKSRVKYLNHIAEAVNVELRKAGGR